MKKILMMLAMIGISGATIADDYSGVIIKDVNLISGIINGYNIHSTLILKDEQDCLYHVATIQKSHVSGSLLAENRVFSTNDVSTMDCKGEVSRIYSLLLDENNYNGIKIIKKIKPNTKAKLVIFEKKDLIK